MCTAAMILMPVSAPIKYLVGPITCFVESQGASMKRRDSGVLGGAAVWPLAARAQQRAPDARLGVLMAVAESDADVRRASRHFRQRLQELDSKDGDSIRIDHRWGGGDAGLIDTLAKKYPTSNRRSDRRLYSFGEGASETDPRDTNRFPLRHGTIGPGPGRKPRASRRNITGSRYWSFHSK